MKKTLIILSSLVIAVSCLTAVNAATTNYNNENTVTTTRQQRPQFDKTKMLSNWVCKDGSTPQFDKTKMKNRPERPAMENKGQRPDFTGKNGEADGQNRPPRMGRPPQGENGQRPEFKNGNGNKNYNGQNKHSQTGRHEHHMMPPLVCSDGSTPTRKTTTQK